MKKFIIIFTFSIWTLCISQCFVSEWLQKEAINEMIELYTPKLIRVCEKNKLLMAEIGGQGAFRKLIFRYGVNIEDASFLRIVALEATDAHDNDGIIRYFYCDAKEFYKNKPERIVYPRWEELLPYEVTEKEYESLWKKLTGGGEVELLEWYYYSKFFGGQTDEK